MEIAPGAVTTWTPGPHAPTRDPDRRPQGGDAQRLHVREPARSPRASRPRVIRGGLRRGRARAPSLHAYIHNYLQKCASVHTLKDVVCRGGLLLYLGLKSSSLLAVDVFIISTNTPHRVTPHKGLRSSRGSLHRASQLDRRPHPALIDRARAARLEAQGARSLQRSQCP
jgi:hypothetical protein